MRPLRPIFFRRQTGSLIVFNREYLGHESEPTAVLVEAGQLQLFCKAIGEARDIYTDVSAAQAAGHRSILAPPTFGTCLYALAPAVPPSLEDLGIDYRYLLHGEESYEYHAPIYAGDTITLRRKVAEIYEKKGGALEFMVLETSATNQLDELVQVRRSVLVMRDPEMT